MRSPFACWRIAVFSRLAAVVRMALPVPLIAGIFAMPKWSFQVANFTSAFVWCAVLLTLGDVTSRLIKWIGSMLA